VSALTPLEVEGLRRFFAGSGAALGEKSPLGAQLKRMRLGLSRQTSCPDLADQLGQDTVDWLKVDRRLRQAGPKARRVLEALLGPADVRGPDSDREPGDPAPDHGHVAPVLPLYGEVGRVMLLTKAAGGASEADLRKADALARKGNREAASWLAEVRAETDELIAWAEAAYAKTRPPRQTRAEMAGELGKVLDDAQRDADRTKGVFRGPRPRAPPLAERIHGQRRVVFATPSAMRAAGDRR
jgi:hypothetical protein